MDLATRWVEIRREQRRERYRVHVRRVVASGTCGTVRPCRMSGDVAAAHVDCARRHRPARRCRTHPSGPTALAQIRKQTGLMADDQAAAVDSQPGPTVGHDCLRLGVGLRQATSHSEVSFVQPGPPLPTSWLTPRRARRGSRRCKRSRGSARIRLQKIEGVRVEGAVDVVHVPKGGPAHLRGDGISPEPVRTGGLATA